MPDTLAVTPRENFVDDGFFLNTTLSYKVRQFAYTTRSDTILTKHLSKFSAMSLTVTGYGPLCEAAAVVTEGSSAKILVTDCNAPGHILMRSPLK